MPQFARPRRAAMVLALAVSALVAGGIAGPAGAAPADAAAGRALAERWCAACHVVAPGQGAAVSDAPTFTAIAARDGDVSGAWLSFRLLKPHPQMPQVSLTRDEAADLAAYFATLRK